MAMRYDAASRPHRVLLCVPEKHDTATIDQILRTLKAQPLVCTRFEELDPKTLGEMDAFLVSEEMLDEDSLELLIQLLQGQPEWSDLPVLLVCTGGTDSALAQRAMQALTGVLLLERPVRLATLTSALRMALRIRRRQYHLRDLLQKLHRREVELRKLADNLEQRVTERTQLAEARAVQLRALAVELIESEERERRQFAHLLHDDLQQMLASARYQLLTISGGLAADPALENVTRILEESIGKSRHLSHALSPPVLHRGGLHAAIEWLAAQMNENFGLEVQLDAADTPELKNSPVKVFVFRAVQELLFNVVKHASVKNARVVLAGRSGHLEATVSDQGKGFDQADLDRTRLKKGFGLISIRERARHIGGDLKIESEPGRGSRFHLTVPVQPAAEESAHAPSEAPLHAVSKNTAPRDVGLRVLFADDHKVMRQGLIRLISAQPDIRVAGEAANGREAVEFARRLRPDVILMDISMPGMDGIEATRRIKAELPDVRIIGLSMFEDKNSARNMIDAGADSFVPKTVSSAELLKAIYGSSE